MRLCIYGISFQQDILKVIGFHQERCDVYFPEDLDDLVSCAAQDDYFDCFIMCDNQPSVCAVRNAGFQGGLIVMGSFKSAEDRIPFHEVGASALLDLPFDKDELRALVISKASRRGGSGMRVVTAGHMRIDMLTRKVHVDDEHVYLTNKEFLIVERLALNIRKLVSHEALARYVYGLEDANPESMTVLISKVRKKFAQFKIVGSVPYEPLKNVWGQGFLLDP